MKIPVVLVTGALPAPVPGDAVIQLARPVHSHPDGESCVACAAVGDVRVALYDLLESRRLSGETLPARVLIDASMIGDPEETKARLTGEAPATALRDHIVARTFALAEKS